MNQLKDSEDFKKFYDIIQYYNTKNGSYPILIIRIRNNIHYKTTYEFVI